MPESKEHKKLVLDIAQVLLNSKKYMSVMADIPNNNSWETPQTVNNFRPDVLAIGANGSKITIGEAKTWLDLKTRRSENQIEKFLSHLEKNGGDSCFILGVLGHQSAEYSRGLLKSMINHLNLTKCLLQVYDGLDYWSLNIKTGDTKWHLL